MKGETGESAFTEAKGWMSFEKETVINNSKAIERSRKMRLEKNQMEQLEGYRQLRNRTINAMKEVDFSFVVEICSKPVSLVLSYNFLIFLYLQAINFNISEIPREIIFTAVIVKHKLAPSSLSPQIHFAFIFYDKKYTTSSGVAPVTFSDLILYFSALFIHL